MELSLTGNDAIAYAMKQLNPDVIAAYPITPSTTIPERVSEYVNSGLMDTEFISVESEHSAMAASIGASLAGARTMTATSSNGLMYMFEMLHIASGLRTSLVLSLVTRAVSAPLNIHNDHSDAMEMRNTGFIMLFSEDNQEAYDNFIIGTKLAEDQRISLPLVVIQDGYIVSHKNTNMEVLDDEAVKNFVGEYKRENTLLDKDNPVTYGALDLPPYLFEHKKGQLDALIKSKDVLRKIDEEYEKISGRKYSFFEEYMLDDAERVIVILGSGAGNVKDVVDDLRAKGEKVGLLKIRLYRPFPGKEIINAINSKQNIKSIAVLDKAMPFGGEGGALYLDFASALYTYGNDLYGNQDKNKKQYNVLNYIYGIGGRDFKPEYIYKVFEELKEEKQEENHVRYLGLRGEE